MHYYEFTIYPGQAENVGNWKPSVIPDKQEEKEPEPERKAYTKKKQRKKGRR